ncbi:MAG TPA: hypothetical protein VFW19_07495 [Allosphingosinicella sp.]|nr:hypothetical protein [Allosphingosinicella sp.]
MTTASCASCGGALGAADLQCPACGAGTGAVIGDPAPVAAAAPATASALSDESSLTRFGQVAKTVALLAFLLPWVTISCAGQQIASISGARLATGIVSIRNPMTGAVERHAGSQNWFLLLAALAIVLALLVSFVRSGKAGALGGLILSAAAAALAAYAILVDIPHQLLAGIHQQQNGGADAGSGGDFGASMANSIEHAIKVDPAIGFWITLLALAAAIVLDWRLQSRSVDGG